MITDAQARVIENNCLGLTYEEIQSLTKDEAVGIISDMYSQDATRYGKNQVAYWDKIKSIVGKAGWNSRANSRTKLPSNPLYQL